MWNALQGDFGRSYVTRQSVADAIAPPSGCVFRTRCPYAIDECAHAVPPLRDVAPEHRTATIRDDVP